MTNLPWVLVVNSFNDFGVAINAKIQASIGRVQASSRVRLPPSRTTASPARIPTISAG